MPENLNFNGTDIQHQFLDYIISLMYTTCFSVSADVINYGFVWSFVEVVPCKIFIMVYKISNIFCKLCGFYIHLAFASL